MKASNFALISALLTLSAVSAVADEKPRDLTVEQAAIAAAAAPHPGNLATTVTSDRADATYAVGETVHLTLTTNQNAFVTVLDVGPTGETTVLFPNRFQPDNHLLAGRAVEIGGPGTGASIKVSPPTGAELIKVITSTKPVTIIPDAQLAGVGPYRSVVGGSKAVSRDLQVATENPPSSDTVIAFSNFGLYTVPNRTVAGGVTVVVPGQPTTTASTHVAVPAEQPFPLLIATNKAIYRISEKPTIVVSTAQACNLTVLEFNASGVARTIFPTAANPDNAVGALQSVFVAGAPNTDFALSGPAGEEQILATCTVGPIAAASGDASSSSPTPNASTASSAQPLTPAPGATADASTVAHNLTIVASKPGTAMASVVFSVKP